MTHYQTLGVSETATPEEIKKAYRKLASQHHPDKGGDTKQFQEIQTAYDIVSNEQKRAQYDNDRRGGGFRFTVNGQDVNGFDQMGPDFENMFRQFGFGAPNFGQGFSQHQPRRNKDLRVNIPVTLASTLAEQKKTVSVQTTNGQRETVEVIIPRGITHDTQIKYPGLGDNFFSSLARGDLYVHVTIIQQPPFTSSGLDLHTNIEINCLDAITGGETEVVGLDDSRFSVVIPQGTQPGTTLRIKGQGLWQLNSSTRGNLLVKIHVTVPVNLSTAQLNLINQIKNCQ